MLPYSRAVEALRLVLDGPDRFAAVQAGAHRAATSAWSGKPEPTRAQLEANAYATGPVSWHGVALRIENPAHTAREGADPDGVPWRNVMKAHYGHIEGTRGADGDEIDVFLGPEPEGRIAWVINQRDGRGGFDEHKVLLGFPDLRAAVDAYRLSYTPGWDRYGAPVALSLAQLTWWLKFGDHRRELTPDQVPPEQDMQTTSPDLPRVFWDSAAMPTSQLTLADVLYRVRVHDGADGLLLDAMTMADLREGAEVLALDALVTEAGRLAPKMQALLRIMEAAGSDVKPLAVQISEPLRRYGGAHVAALFELSDGQTVTVWFHNPDSTPAKLTPADELVSWKWLLNKKDITIVVAPESGADLNLREVARRVMRLAQKNSAAFARANTNRAARMAEIQSLRDTLTEKQGILAGLHQQIEVAKVAAADRSAAAEAESNARKQKLADRAKLIVATWRVGDGEGAWNLQQEQDELLGVPGATKREDFFQSMTAVYGAPLTKPLPITPGTPGYVEWEDALTRLVEERMEADRGDAQGMIEAQEMMQRGILRRMHEEGVSAETAYQRLFGDEAALADDEQVKPPPGGEGGELTAEQKIAAVQAAYTFDNATPEFLAWLHDSLGEKYYSPFVTARDMDKAVKGYGGSAEWGFSRPAAMDSADGGEKPEGDDEAKAKAPPAKGDAEREKGKAPAKSEGAGGEEDEDDFDAEDEWKATPEEDEEGTEAKLDGDFPGHPFRGNQYVKAHEQSGTAVRASKRAKHAEGKKDKRSQRLAHAEAHHAHKAAAISAKGKARAYHKKMAKFHGSRGGVLDGVAVFDRIPELDGTEYVGKVVLDGKLVGRIDIAADGKAMVYVGVKGDQRVTTPSGNRYYYSDDDAVDMVHALFRELAAAKVEPEPEPSKTAAELGLADATDEAVALLAANAAAAKTARAIEVEVVSRGGEVSWDSTNREPEAPVLDSLFELDGARFVRGDITYRSRPLASVTINGTGQAFFTAPDGSALVPGLFEGDGPEAQNEARETAKENGWIGWTTEADDVLAELLSAQVTDPIDEEVDGKVIRGENKFEDDGDAPAGSILDRANEHWKRTLGQALADTKGGKTVDVGVMFKGGLRVKVQVVRRNTNRATFYVVLTKEGQRKASDNIPFPSIDGRQKLLQVAGIFMAYLSADEPSGWKIGPPGYTPTAEEAGQGDRDPVAVRAQAMRRALGAMGWEEGTPIEAGGIMMHSMLKRTGDELLKIATAQSEGAITLMLAKMNRGALVADLELPDDTARSPEENARLAASLADQLKGDEPEPPAESAELKFLREVKAGAHDALDLGALLDKIEASIQALQNAGALEGDADLVAGDALARWVTLDEKANGA